MFEPQQYSIPDASQVPFIDAEEIRNIISSASKPTDEQVIEVVKTALSRKRLSLQQTAILLNAESQRQQDIIFEAAKQLKIEVYGKRIVIFAPLYVGNLCINNCRYCGFRAGNKQAFRRTLNDGELVNEVRELEKTGQKRLILVYGEHDKYNAEYIAHTVGLVYNTHEDTGKINRVNINAAPLDVEGFGRVKEAGIGTYQIFQETYDPDRYAVFHPSGKKADYNYRLTAMDRAMEAGIDDVGLGVLFGLGDWKFEVLALIRHTNHLEKCFGVGPHTISFPRINKASNMDQSLLRPVSDDDFARLIAILRLAVPYTGLIMTAREKEGLRDKLIDYGVSQIDAGTNLEIGGYSENRKDQSLEREQFELMDTRGLEQTISGLIDKGQIPSFCTACYRKGRTGEHFMEFSTKGFIKRFCTPNALLTFAEYLEDYASEDTKIKGWDLIDNELSLIENPNAKESIAGMLQSVKEGKRDILL